MKKLNFNALAWDTPEHNGRYEYQPTDKYYNEIVEWLRSAYEKMWEIANIRSVTKRLCLNNSWDVVATYYRDTKGISYIFREHNIFEVTDSDVSGQFS